MSQQKLTTNTSINESGDEDYLYEEYLANEKLNEQYWENKAQETIDTINAYYDNRYCAADVESAVAEVTNDERVIGAIMQNLNEIYLRRQVMDIQLNG